MVTPAVALLEADPEPSLLLDASGTVIDANPAAVKLATRIGISLTEMLPVNAAALTAASLGQVRPISGLKRDITGTVLSWVFVPVADSDHVLARGRDATAQVQAQREATTASRLYRLIIENTTDLISRHAPDGSFIDASPASWRLLGYWPEELRGQPVTRLLQADDEAQLLAPMRQQLRDTGYATMTLRLRHRDGSVRWFETASRAIRETYTGAVVEAVSVSRDITGRVESEENNRRLAQVVEANTDLVLFITRDGALTYLNPAARRALAVSESDVNGLTIQQLLEPAELRRFIRDGLPRTEQYGSWETETRFCTSQGQASLPVSLVVLFHRGVDGSAYYSLVARDMTERESRESERRRHQEELAHASRLATLGELASGIAHEINQPLATIVNYANASQRYLAQAATQPEALQRVSAGLDRINQHANHAAEVIKRLRSFLRKGNRRVEYLSVNEVVSNAVQLCQWEATKHQVSISQVLHEQNPGVFADPVLLEQVIINLLRNAIEANRELARGRESEIAVHTSATAEGSVLVEVDDEGPGLDDTGLEQMFTPFFTAKSEGLGLGLSMSRSIVEGFGGYLDARRLPDGGLRLTCRFPPRAVSGASKPMSTEH